MEEGSEEQRVLKGGTVLRKVAEEPGGNPEEEGSLGRKLWLKRGLAPLPQGCDGDDANRAQEQKSGCDSNRRCQGTAPRFGAASGPWDRGAGVGVGRRECKSFFADKKRNKRKNRAVPRKRAGGGRERGVMARHFPER